MARARVWRWLWFLPAALLLWQGGVPEAVLAGSGPFDNSGRIPCDRQGLIDASWRNSPGLTAPTELHPGAMATVPAVCPAERYFPTGVLLTPGATYQIDAQGLWQDGWIRVGPEGWPGLLLQAWNRLRWKPFFFLGGSMGPSEHHLFPIGRGRLWTAPTTLPANADRQLYLFANDWPGMLHNNRTVPDEEGGPLRVTISRIN
jgi:hypothetical protein